MDNNFIPVFFCTDNEFAVPAYIALYSLLYNHHGNLKIRAFILTSEDFSEDNIHLFNSLQAKYHNLELKIINMMESYSTVKINSSQVTTATLYRLMIPRIVAQINEQVEDKDQIIEKCIYLDSDLVVERDISELYNLDIENYYIAGVRDKALSNENLVSLKVNLGISTLSTYVNAGVLLFNLKEIFKCGLGNKLEEAGYRDDLRFNDQDAVNIVFYGGIKVLPLKYNAYSTRIYYNDQSFYEQYGYKNIVEARKKPVIIHYILHGKPWCCRFAMLAGKWWKYVKMQDRNIQREYIQTFLDTHKSTVRHRIRETLRTIVILLKHFCNKTSKLNTNLI